MLPQASATLGPVIPTESLLWQCGGLYNALSPSLQRCLSPHVGNLRCVTLHGKTDFADVVKEPELERLSWAIWVGPIW